MQSIFDHSVQFVFVLLILYITVCLSKQKLKQVYYAGFALISLFSLKVACGDSIYQRIISLHSKDDVFDLFMSTTLTMTILVILGGYATKQIYEFHRLLDKQ